MKCPSPSTELKDEDDMIWFYECQECKAIFNKYKIAYPEDFINKTQRAWWEFWKR